MKSFDAKLILGDNRISELFLQGNSSYISAFCRNLLMQSRFYSIPIDVIAEFLSKEMKWQDKVYNSYCEHLASSRIPPSVAIEMDSNNIF